MALFPGDMNIGWGFGLYPEKEQEELDDDSLLFITPLGKAYLTELEEQKKEEGVFDLEEMEGVLTRIDTGNRTITLDTSWLFHCSPSLMSHAGRYPVGTVLLVEYRMDAMGQRRVKNIVLRKEVEG